jgi:hypothetical protein
MVALASVAIRRVKRYRRAFSRPHHSITVTNSTPVYSQSSVPAGNCPRRLLQGNANDRFLDLGGYPLLEGGFTPTQLPQRRFSAFALQSLEAMKLARLYPITLHARDPLPSCLAYSDNPTLILITFYAVFISLPLSAPAGGSDNEDSISVSALIVASTVHLTTPLPRSPHCATSAGATHGLRGRRDARPPTRQATRLGSRCSGRP